MTSADYDSIIRWSTDSIDIRHFSYLGSLRAREGRDESSVSMDIDDGPATEISSLIWRVAYRRAKGLPIDDLELPDLSGFFGGDEEAEPESEASIAAPDESTLPAQDFGQIPEALAKYAEADESAEDFRRRAFNLLFRFGIAEGENFEGGGEPLTPEEKIKLLPMLIANFNAGNWLKLTEDLNPQA